MTEDKNHQPFVIDDTVYRTRLTKKFQARRPWKEPDPRQVTAFIPGVIRQVHVRDGQTVREGEPLFVLEAMKMMNTVLAHADGRIRQVHIKVGDQVAKGQLLVHFD